jgi:transposase
MTGEKYIGLDVHQATISVAVMDSQGKVVMESILETKASTLLEFFAGLRGSLFVTFEEGTWAAWLYDLLKPHVTEVLVCNPRKIPLLKQGNKSDKIDARKLAERLRLHDPKGYISDPATKAKSVVLTDEGAKRSQDNAISETDFRTVHTR